MGRLPGGIVALTFVSFFTDVAGEGLYPLLPLYLVGVLHAQPAAIGIIEGVADATASLVKLFSGALADRLGRAKPLVFVGYALSSIAKPLLVLASHWTHVLGLRFLDRTGKGIRSAPRDAWLAAMAPPNQYERAYGFNRAGDNLGAVVGPLLAGAYLYYHPGDYRSLFLLAIVPGLIATALVLVPREERVRVDPKRWSWRDLGLLPKELRAFFWILLVFTLGNSSDAFLLLRLKAGGVGEAWIPVLWALLHVVKVIVSLQSHRLTDRFSNQPVIVAGWLVYAATYGAMGFVTSTPALVAVFLGYGAFAGLTEGPERGLVARMAPPAQRGTAFGLFAMTVGLATLPASLLFGAIWSKVGMQAAFYFGASLALIAAACLAMRPRMTSISASM